MRIALAILASRDVKANNIKQQLSTHEDVIGRMAMRVKVIKKVKRQGQRKHEKERHRLEERICMVMNEDVQSLIETLECDKDNGMIVKDIMNGRLVDKSIAHSCIVWRSIEYMEKLQHHILAN